MKPNRKSHLARLILSTIATPVALVFTATHVQGATTYTGAGDDWASVGNWSGGSVPAGAFNQRLNFTGNTTVTFTAAQGTVELASSAGADNRAFVLGNTNPNAGTTSVLNITGGILRINSAANSASTSTSSLVGANGLNSNGTLNVSGTGTLDLTTGGGTNHRNLSIGLGGTANTGISGTVNISGSGLIKVSQFRFAETGPSAGGSITGVLNLNGGTLETGVVQEVTGAANSLVSSTVNLNGGLLRLTGATGISDSIDTVNVNSGGANIEVNTGVSSSVATALLDGGGGGGLTKTGDGTLGLLRSNTFTGPIRINAGVLRFATQESLYNNISASWTAANINVSSGATLAINVDSAGTAGFTSANLDTLLANVSVANLPTEGLQAGASLSINTGTATGASFTQGNIIADSTGANGGTIGLNKDATGELVLDKANTYSGVTNLTVGSVNIQHANALGSAAAGTTLANGARLDLQGGITTAAEALILTPGTGGNAMLRNVSGNNAWSGSITSNTATNTQVSRIQSNLGKLTMSGAVNVTGSTHQLVLQGDGDMEISGQITGVGRVTSSATGTGVRTLSNDTNSYTGATLVNGGKLAFMSINNVGAASSSLGAPDLADATINIGGTTTAGTLLYVGTAIGGHSSDRVINLSGTTGGATIEANGTGPLVLTGFNTATGAGIKTLTLSGTNTSNNSIGVIVNNSVTNTTAVTKSGGGKWILNGSNTYTGATAINEGTLVITGATQATSAITFGGGILGLDIASPVTAASATVDFTGQSVLVSGNPSLESHTLLTTTSPITGTPSLASPAPSGYSLQVVGNELRLVQTGGSSAYSTWAAVNATSGDPDDDSDGDGVPNAVEFVLGGLATTNDLGKLPTVATSGGNLTFTFQRAQSSIDPQTSSVIEVSTDLATWNTAPSPYTVPDGAAANNPGLTVVKDSPTAGTDAITLTVPQSPDAKKFARLKVVITP